MQVPFRQRQRPGMKDIELSDASSVSTISIPQGHGSVDHRPVSFVGLTRYALPRDRILQVFGVVFCTVAGTALVGFIAKVLHKKLINYHSH